MSCGSLPFKPTLRMSKTRTEPRVALPKLNLLQAGFATGKNLFFSALEEVFVNEKAPFLPPLAFLGYVPIPAFCSYCP